MDSPSVSKQTLTHLRLPGVLLTDAVVVQPQKENPDFLEESNIVPSLLKTEWLSSCITASLSWRQWLSLIFLFVLGVASLSGVSVVHSSLFVSVCLCTDNLNRQQQGVILPFVYWGISPFNKRDSSEPSASARRIDFSLRCLRELNLLCVGLWVSERQVTYLTQKQPQVGFSYSQLSLLMKHRHRGRLQRRAPEP